MVWRVTRKGRGRNRGGKPSNQDKSGVQCYNCHEFGHYVVECKNPRRERNQVNNLIQDHFDNEPALLLSSFDEGEEVVEVFLNEKNINPPLKTR